MKQILHIFAKDVRRLWPEILISLATLAAFVWIYPQDWGLERSLASQFQWLTGGTVFLVIIGWVLLIARDIHGETLVGERQFWITRPYRWPCLLAAKALFLFVFLLVPFFLVQPVFLHIVGFPAMPYLWGSLFNVVFMAGMAVVPLVAIATMTSNFGKMLLGILVVIVYIALVAFINTRLPTSGYEDDYVGVFTFFAFGGVLIAAIVLQYAQRRTAVSRMLTAGMAVTISLLTLSGPENLPMRLAYPGQAGSAAVSVEVSFKRRVEKPKKDVAADPAKREVSLNLPLDIAGIQSGTAVQADYGRLEIASASGEHWASHWQSVHEIWEPSRNEAFLRFMVSDAFYRRVKDKPANVSLTLAMTGMEAGKTIYTAMPKGKLTTPGGMQCSVDMFPSLRCFAPLRLPPLMLATVKLSHHNCPAGEPRDSEGGYGEAWLGVLNPSIDPGLTPISEQFLKFNVDWKQGRGNYLCEGTPFSFTPYRVVWRGQKTIPVGSIHLEDYAWGS